jgi:hypothetical protein
VTVRTGSILIVPDAEPSVCNSNVPAGWVQFGVDENGQPVYGYVGPRNPQWRL